MEDSNSSSNSSSEGQIVVEIPANELFGNKRVGVFLRSFDVMKKEISEQNFFEGKEMNNYVVKLILTKKEGE